MSSAESLVEQLRSVTKTHPNKDTADRPGRVQMAVDVYHLRMFYQQYLSGSILKPELEQKCQIRKGTLETLFRPTQPKTADEFVAKFSEYNHDIKDWAEPVTLSKEMLAARSVAEVDDHIADDEVVSLTGSTPSDLINDERELELKERDADIHKLQNELRDVRARRDERMQELARERDTKIQELEVVQMQCKNMVRELEEAQREPREAQSVQGRRGARWPFW